MKKLQKDFTTPEQSKRLLELGVPVWTANGQYNDFNGDILVPPDWSVFSPVYEDNIRKPCWSAGRLIKIVNVCCTDDNVKDEIAIEVMYSNKNSAQLIIEMMSEYAYVMDFSKLEE